MIIRKTPFLFSIPFSFIYFFIVTMRNIFYAFNIFKRHRINAKVISVGNITWGGTGKTPVAAFIADFLARKNRRVSILIRGYGNDESELLPRLTSNVPVLAGKDRVKTGAEAVDNHLSDTVILDDGFQYRRLERDLDIVCIDAARPFGNGWAIPAGSLREGLGSLKRADIFLITKADLISSKDRLEKLEKRLRVINPEALIAKAIHRPLYFYRLSNIIGDGLKPSPINEKNGPFSPRRSPAATYEVKKVMIGELQDREIALVSAIGSPECFEKTILRLGLKIGKHFIFRDHHAYTKENMAQVEDYCKKNSLKTIIVTEKDAVKLTRLQLTAYSLQLLVLKVRLEIIENEDGFYNRLFGIYSS